MRQNKNSVIQELIFFIKVKDIFLHVKKEFCSLYRTRSFFLKQKKEHYDKNIQYGRKQSPHSDFKFSQNFIGFTFPTSQFKTES
jgi:hypothetical protein